MYEEQFNTNLSGTSKKKTRRGAAGSPVVNSSVSLVNLVHRG